jgi:hypothetical protein
MVTGSISGRLRPGNDNPEYINSVSDRADQSIVRRELMLTGWTAEAATPVPDWLKGSAQQTLRPVVACRQRGDAPLIWGDAVLADSVHR